MSDLADELAAEAAEEQTATPAATLEAIQALAHKAKVLNDEIIDLEAQVSQKKEEKNLILGRTLVDMMTQAKVSIVGVDGKFFSLESYYKASIPEDKREEGHNWLEENDAGDLIKYQIIVSLPKDSMDEVKKIEAQIKLMSNAAEVETKRSVPWKRLTSWCKDYVENILPSKPELPPLPVEILGATVGRVVKIKDK